MLRPPPAFLISLMAFILFVPASQAAQAAKASGAPHGAAIPVRDRPSPPAAPVISRMTVEEANQGVASDGTHIYAIDNDRIGKYEIDSGRRIAQWQGRRADFPHMNSCTVVETRLVCAASNYPAVPQTSAVEIFDTATLRHIRTVSLGIAAGSLTVMDHHQGKYWAVFAHYDGRGGEPGRDHRYTMLVRMNDAFQQEAAWVFPPEVLERFAPFSCSGASWGADGRLYATGHDRGEAYVLELPEAGSVLRLVRTIGIATPGQAIDWDPVKTDHLWSVDRAHKQVVASRIEQGQ